jgi:heptosyltransferase-2
VTRETIVVRVPNWLGDTVMALPALRALRAGRGEEARIAAVGPWVAVLAGQGAADLLVWYPPEPHARRAVDRAIAAERPDLALLLPNSLSSALAARRWSARRRIGFATDARAVLLTEALALPDPRRHQVDEYLFLAEAAGGRAVGNRPCWTRRPDPAAATEVERLLETAGVPREGDRHRSTPLVGLHLGAAGGPAKQWMPERFGELAASLARAGATPLLLGAPADQPAAARAAAASGARVPSVVGRDRVELLPHLLARLHCLVSGDTGVAHLAAALDVPTVTLFGPTDEHLTAPRGPRARVLGGSAPCAPCFLRQCPIDHICLGAIGAELVAARVLEAVA